MNRATVNRHTRVIDAVQLQPNPFAVFIYTPECTCFTFRCGNSTYLNLSLLLLLLLLLLSVNIKSWLVDRFGWRLWQLFSKARLFNANRFPPLPPPIWGWGEACFCLVFFFCFVLFLLLNVTLSERIRKAVAACFPLGQSRKTSILVVVVVILVRKSFIGLSLLVVFNIYIKRKRKTIQIFSCIECWGGSSRGKFNSQSTYHRVAW